ncbi:MAG: leucine-rich repeat protein, partial [Clostridia bacterium]|nr:leucine-rich repeat protein [Clostridia bacterium]
VEWYTKAAEQGHITSQFNLAVRYANGRGVERNDKKAVEWYTKAAEQGDNDAKKELEKLQKKRTISNDVSKGSDYKANTDGKTCKHEPVITPAQSPTCTKPGITEASVCKLCGTTLKEAQPIPPTGHRFGVWQTVKEATCTEDGLQKRRCDCGKEETKPIPAHGAHTPGEWMTVKEPTENETGLKVRTCSVCGTRTEEEKIPALPILQANPGTQETSVSEGLSYEVNPDDETCSVTGQGTCKDRHIVIPETIDGYRVTGIITKTKGVSGFKPYIKSVSIPNSVMSIGESAFEDSVNLKSVLIPDSVTSIGESAFSRCKSLASVVIPDFVKSIGEKTFYCCTSLASVVIPGSVTNIGDEAFYYCQSLASVVIADSVKSIDDQVFHGLGNLASVVIPESVTSIGHSAFYGCTRLTRAVIPKSVTRIGSWAFRGCTSLVSVIIPDSVMHIGECAFWDCTSLASVEIPKSVTSIDEAAFIGVGGISVSVDNLSYRSIDGNLYTKDGRTLLYYAANKKNTTFIIPDSVTHIGERALQRCRNLVSVVIPDSVWSIGTLAFYDCTSLASVVIPDSVKSIGKSAFSGCTSLASVVIPDSITSIGNWAFNDCTSLASVVIPDSVWSIGEYAFCDCTGLASAVISDSVTSIDERAFKGCKSLASLRYTGTKAQWNQIVLGSDWKQNTLLRAVECTDGTIPFS